MFEEEFIGVKWVKKVEELLKGFGARFEAEESVRIHVGDVIVEVSESGGGFAIALSIEIPKSLSLEDVDRCANAYRDMLKLLVKSGAEPSYELDTSIGYTFLRATIELKDVSEVLDLLRKMLS
jgi:hypothetical protein